MERSLSEVYKEFDRAYKLYGTSIHNFCISRLADEEEAESCFIDAFAAYFTNLKNGVEVLNPRAYLYRCARNFIYRSYQNKMRAEEQKNLPFYEETFDNEIPRANTAFEAIEHPEEANKEEYLEVCFSQMSDIEIAIYKARWEKGCTIKEVTEQLNITEGNAKIRSKRVKDKMKAIIAEEYERRRP